MKLYSVRDIMTGFMPPISIANDLAAVRFFKEYACKKSDIPKHDLEIWRIGEMSEDNGIILPETPVKLFAGKDCLDAEIQNSI